jgi:hypothetical protein
MTAGRAAGVLAVTVVLVAILTGCVGHAATTGAYRGKAHHSAQAASSSLQTALLAVQTSAKGNLLDPYLDTVLSQAEDDLGSVQQQFDSIQPPNTTEADALRNQLDTLLTKGSSTLSDLRIAARRDQQGEMVHTAQDIPPLVTKLDSFARATS